MNIISDYHIHSYLCKHADGMPEEYIEKAREMGLKSIGFSDHCPVPVGYDSDNRMSVSEYKEYFNLIYKCKKKYCDINILFGMEVDWVPGRMDELENFLQETKYDYLLGSIHYVDGLPFDHPDYILDWNSEERINYVWKRYFELMYDLISWGKFDVIAHIDLPKKYSMIPADMGKFYEMANDVLALASKKDIMLELNTSGLRKKVKNIYPSAEILKLAYKNDVKIVFGSDAHTPNDVARDFDIASDIAKLAGYKEYFCLYEDKRREEVKL
jgi:histidinol-phosphatase (PHP family)